MPPDSPRKDPSAFEAPTRGARRGPGMQIRERVHSLGNVDAADILTGRVETVSAIGVVDWVCGVRCWLAL
jgi:hypothetical protein